MSLKYSNVSLKVLKYFTPNYLEGNFNIWTFGMVFRFSQLLYHTGPVSKHPGVEWITGGIGA